MSQEHRIVILPEAEAHIRGIMDRRAAAQIATRIRDLRESPELQGKMLLGELAGYRRVRAGRYWIMYRIQESPRAVYIAVVGIRRDRSKHDVYRVAYRMVQRGLL